MENNIIFKQALDTFQEVVLENTPIAPTAYNNYKVTSCLQKKNCRIFAS